MAKEQIVDRILADAKTECDGIIASAKSRADSIVKDADDRAKAELAETQREADERAKSVAEGKAAAARLDSQKILLAEKRRVIDEIYAHALNKLLALKEKESLKLIERLLKENAEEGDEVVLAENFKYDISKLSVVKDLKLKISSKRAPLSGGCVLHGKKSDKDLSYSALLNADAEENQAAIAAKLFVRKDV